MSVLPNTPSPNAAPLGTEKRARKSIERFPLRFHCAITPAMGEAIKQMTGNNSLLSESDIGRLALHGYLLTNNAAYARAMQNGNRNA
jgi:hypothetical protein